MSQSEPQAIASQRRTANNEIAICPVKYDPKHDEKLYMDWVAWLGPVDYAIRLLFKDNALYVTLIDDDDAKRTAMRLNGKAGVDDDTVTVYVMSKEEREDVHRGEAAPSNGGLGGHVPA